MKSPTETVRACYAAYEAKDRSLIEPLLAEDFTFSSPLDDNINRQRYFERCWPNCENVDHFDILETVEAGDEVFVRYRAHPKQGPDFENAEVFTFADGQVQHVDVYFGPESRSRTTGSSDEQEIRNVIETRADAIRNKYAEALVALTAKDSVRFELAPPLKADISLRENAEKWFATWSGPIGYEIRELKITAGADVAFAYNLTRMSGKKVTGEQVDVWFRETTGFRRIDGKWWITHEHESVPFYMDGSFKAAVDLQPAGASQN